MSTKDDLEYYLGYAPDTDLIAEAEDWQQENPGVCLDEWVSAMSDAGLL